MKNFFNRFRVELDFFARKMGAVRQHWFFLGLFSAGLGSVFLIFDKKTVPIHKGDYGWIFMGFCLILIAFVTVYNHYFNKS